MATIIRRATKEDCPRIMDLIHELADYEKRPEEVDASLSHFEESCFGPHPVCWAFVAEIDSIIYGFALYYIRYSTWKGQRMYLEDIYVVPEKRRQGVGKLLFEQLIIEAEERKFSGMNWQVLDWNELALGFYRKYKTNFDPVWVNCSIEFKV
ncbi:MAG: GNAT family N-acetyltransferase [Bacteroidales bacterium]|nr:GNAT family N-acetyltransferase [Bacteroidales bacterium]MCL2133324.1 GNAT family N-acetyltransferase [Bacteroidales bacterium]